MWTCKLFNSLEAVNAGPVRRVFLMSREISLVDIIHCAIDVEVHNSVIYHWTYFGDWFSSEVKLGHNHFELFHLDTSLYKYMRCFTFLWDLWHLYVHILYLLWIQMELQLLHWTGWVKSQEQYIPMNSDTRMLHVSHHHIWSVISFNLFIKCRLAWE